MVTIVNPNPSEEGGSWVLVLAMVFIVGILFLGWVYGFGMRKTQIINIPAASPLPVASPGDVNVNVTIPSASASPITSPRPTAS